MAYVIPVVLVVLAIAGFLTFMVLNATRKTSPVADADEDAPGIGADRTPLGDTTQHAGEQTEGGTTRSDPEDGPSRRPAETEDGTRSDPEDGPGRRPAEPDVAAHVGRPGEGEGAERLEFEGEQPRPASERLANRDA